MSKTARGSFEGTKQTFKGRFYLAEGIKDLEGTLTAPLEDFRCPNATITYDDAADLDGICDIPVLTPSFIGIDLFEVTLKSYTTGGVAKLHGQLRPPIDNRTIIGGSGKWTPGQED